MGTWRTDQISAIKTLLLAIHDGSARDLIADVQDYPEAVFTGFPAVRVLAGAQETDFHSNRAVQATRSYKLQLYMEKSNANYTKQESQTILNKILDQIVTKFNGNLKLATGVKWTEIDQSEPVYEGPKQDMIRVDFNLKVITIDATASTT